MLRTLSIHDFVIVDAMEIDLAPGFSVFTGETGAGKSILVDALALALGGRGDASVVREGAARADISAEFAVEFDTAPALTAWLRDNAFDNPQEEQTDGAQAGILMRRVIDSSGRSKAYVNGLPATVAQLRELGELLVDIHGQHAHQSLLKSEAQRALLDGHAGLGPQAQALAASYREWRALARQREQFERDARNVLLERERLAWQVGELEKLAPQTGEWDSLAAEHQRLAHAASLIEGAQEALVRISEAEDQPILSQLSALNQKMARLAEVDSALQPVMEVLEPARIQLQEAVYMLNDYLGRIDLDPERLRALEDRIEAMHTLARRFQVAPGDLPAEQLALTEQLRQLADASDLDGLRANEERLQQDYMAAARKLSQARARAAKSLGAAVTAAMQDLSMQGGRFAVQLQACEPGAHGLEQVEFQVAGHAGSSLRALAKVASGGELARIALAISVITSSATATPTLIFDEVDSGIGGAVAEVVGRLLQRLGQERQVLCVTHLAQVASQANQHFQVSKQETAQGQTLSRISALDAKARVEEVARMLGGVEITATTRKHARELLAS